MSYFQDTSSLLARLNVEESYLRNGDLVVQSPITGEAIAEVSTTSIEDANKIIAEAHAAFKIWRNIPAPRRGEFVRQLGNALREHKDDLGRLVSIEAGKISSEGLGEVQEMIDVCDFAVGLSRQLYGLTMKSERSDHRLSETWHPLGVVGVISAFNFPVAVWAWNTTLALVCGNSIVWKPSEKTPLTALACTAIFNSVAKNFDGMPEGLLGTIIGHGDVGEALVNNPTVPLVSATGSTRMGRIVGPKLAARFARSILELGGNNGAIICPSANLDITLRGIAFSAIGTAGQRCTTMRRLFVHDNIYDELLVGLKKIYSSVRIGDPLHDNILLGPLIDQHAYDDMQASLKLAKEEGGKIFGGEPASQDNDGYYVTPALVEMPKQTSVVMKETFAPILYIMRYNNFDDVMEEHNAVGAGLSSCIFTQDVCEAEIFLSARGSDCGIANVNLGTSGAEIGGAFGGEKETGGGRESGSDAWKAYMRRSTNTVNYSTELPLAQGVSFEV